MLNMRGMSIVEGFLKTRGRESEIRDPQRPGLRCGKLAHRGIAQARPHSTLSYAHEHRPTALFEELFFTAMGQTLHALMMGHLSAKIKFPITKGGSEM